MVQFNEVIAGITERGGIEVDDSWRQGRGVFGGLLAGALVRRIQDELNAMDPESTPTIRSLSMQLRTAFPQGFVPVGVEVARSGKYATYLDATFGGEESVVRATAVATRPTSSQSRFEDYEVPQAPPVQEVNSWPQLPFMPSFTRYFEYKSFIGGLPYTGRSEDIAVGGWTRFRDGEKTDLPRLAAYGDAWPLSAMVAASTPGPAASVEIHMQFWGEPDPDQEWFLVRNRSSVARDGYSDQTTHVWGADGTLLLQATQLAVLL